MGRYNKNTKKKLPVVLDMLDSGKTYDTIVSELSMAYSTVHKIKKEYRPDSHFRGDKKTEIESLLSVGKSASDIRKAVDVSSVHLWRVKKGFLATDEGGMKYDNGKLRYDLIPPDVIKALAEVLTFGAAKYSANSWQSVPNGIPRYYAAMQRHVEAWRSGEYTDPESGLTHLSHAMACLSFLITLEDGVEVPWYDA